MTRRDINRCTISMTSSSTLNFIQIALDPHSKATSECLFWRWSRRSKKPGSGRRGRRIWRRRDGGRRKKRVRSPLCPSRCLWFWWFWECRGSGGRWTHYLGLCPYFPFRSFVHDPPSRLCLRWSFFDRRRQFRKRRSLNCRWSPFRLKFTISTKLGSDRHKFCNLVLQLSPFITKFPYFCQ